MIYSAGSITLKGFVAFQITPDNLTPIIKSIEIIKVNKKAANKPVTNIIFIILTHFYVLLLYFYFGMELSLDKI